MMLFVFRLLFLSMHFISGLHSRMSLLLWSICANGVIVETAYVFSVAQGRKIETILFFECSLSMRVWRALMADCRIVDPQLS
jgi:hypothetical protein